MRVGIDFWNVISQHPAYFKELSKSLMWNENDVYIISAVGNRQLKKYANTHEGYIETIKGFKVPCTEIILCDFGDDDSLIPEMKLAECKRLMIDMFYDDRPSTIELLHQNSIAAFLVPKPIKS